MIFAFWVGGYYSAAYILQEQCKKAYARIEIIEGGSGG